MNKKQGRGERHYTCYREDGELNPLINPNYSEIFTSFLPGNVLHLITKKKKSGKCCLFAQNTQTKSVH
jgi:hypothetical protein